MCAEHTRGPKIAEWKITLILTDPFHDIYFEILFIKVEVLKGALHIRSGEEATQNLKSKEEVSAWKEKGNYYVCLYKR